MPKSHLIRGELFDGGSSYKRSGKKYGRFPLKRVKNCEGMPINPGLILLCGDRAPSDRVYHARSNRTTSQRGSKAPQSNPHRWTTRQWTRREDRSRSSCQDAESFASRLSSLRLSSTTRSVET